jgi:hypothetical protein
VWWTSVSIDKSIGLYSADIFLILNGLKMNHAYHNGWAVCTVFARSNTGIVGSNPTRGMDVCAFILFLSSGLVTGWSPVQGVLPTVYGLRNWKSGQGQQRLYSHRQTGTNHFTLYQQRLYSHRQTGTNHFTLYEQYERLGCRCAVWQNYTNISFTLISWGWGIRLFWNAITFLPDYNTSHTMFMSTAIRT